MTRRMLDTGPYPRSCRWRSWRRWAHVHGAGSKRPPRPRRLRPAIGLATLAEARPITPEVSTRELQEILASRQGARARRALGARIRHRPHSRQPSTSGRRRWSRSFQPYADPATLARPLLQRPLLRERAGAFPNSWVKRGYTGVRRYQLGLPVSLALGYTVQTDLERPAFTCWEGDRTAVYVDARADASACAGRCLGRGARAAAARPKVAKLQRRPASPTVTRARGSSSSARTPPRRER